LRFNIFLSQLDRKCPDRPNRRTRRVDRKLRYLYYELADRVGFARNVSKYRYLEADHAARRCRWEANYMAGRLEIMQAGRSTFLKETPFQSPYAWLQQAKEA